MAASTAINPAQILAPTTTRSGPLLRLGLGWVQLIAGLAFVFGTAWDIQWHTAVGRDRLWTSPHLMMLAGIAVAGLVSLAAVLKGTVDVRRGADARRSTTFLGFFHAPLGAYLAGFGALSSLVAFPLDDYWHTLYGVDVTLWAPFHVMIIGGVALIGLGATFTLASAVHQAAEGEDVVVAAWGRIGTVVALASLLGLLYLYLGDTLKPSGVIVTSFGPVEVYAALVAVFGALVLATSVRASTATRPHSRWSL